MAAKEYSTLPKGKTGLFLGLTAKVDGKTPLAMFGGNSGAMIAGHEGTIVEIDYMPIANGAKNVPALREDQIITVAGEEIIFGKKGDLPWALTIKFDTGRTMTVGLLLQGQDKTTVHFLGDANPTPSTRLDMDALRDKMFGKRFKCTKYFRDKANEIQRQDPDDASKIARTTFANCYTFEEVAIA